MHFTAWKIKLHVIWLLYFMSLKVFEDDEDDDNDKFYSKLSQAQSRNYLQSGCFPKQFKKIILKRISWLPMWTQIKNKKQEKSLLAIASQNLKCNKVAFHFFSLRSGLYLTITLFYHSHHHHHNHWWWREKRQEIAPIRGELP